MMKKYVLNESKLKNYVRSLIREALENEGHAHPDTIQRWVNFDPSQYHTTEELENALNSLRGRRQSDVDFNALKNMVLRNGYDRRGLSQATKEIESAWRKKNYPNDSFDGRKKIIGVNPDGSGISDVQTKEEKRKNNVKAATNSRNKKNNTPEAIAKRAAEQAQKEAEREQREKQELDSRTEKAYKIWCADNNLDFNDANSRAKYNAYLEHLGSKEHLRDLGDDEFSADALRRKIAYHQQRMKELANNPSDTRAVKNYNSHKRALEDAQRILRQNFDKFGNLKKITKNVNDSEFNQEIETDASAQKAAAEAMYANNTDFLNWCKSFGCNPSIETEMIYKDYSKSLKKWCRDNNYDVNDESSKQQFNEIYGDYVKSQINNVNTNPLPQSNQTTTNDDLMNDEYDDDFGRGDSMHLLDDVEDADFDEEDYEYWCEDRGLDPDNERNRQAYKKSISGNASGSRQRDDEFDIDDLF